MRVVGCAWRPGSMDGGRVGGAQRAYCPNQRDGGSSSWKAVEAGAGMHRPFLCTYARDV